MLQNNDDDNTMAIFSFSNVTYKLQKLRGLDLWVLSYNNWSLSEAQTHGMNNLNTKTQKLLVKQFDDVP